MCSGRRSGQCSLGNPDSPSRVARVGRVWVSEARDREGEGYETPGHVIYLAEWRSVALFTRMCS